MKTSTMPIDLILDEQTGPSFDEAGFGSLLTEAGNLPLYRLGVRAAITGLAAGIELTQTFRNPSDTPVEATYIFPLPDRAAVTALTMTAGGRVVKGELQERGAARQAYHTAIAAGQRASIAEEERPDVFTMRVGNILPGEDVTVALTLAGPLPFADGQAEFRFPLVVAPRYIPGAALAGPQVGVGHGPDTDAVPDASRITPPVLLPGFPNPVDLSIEVRIDPAGLALNGIASSLHAVSEEDGVIRIHPGERVNRDFILRLAYEEGATALVLVPDAADSADSDNAPEGTYQLTVLPPAIGAASAKPKRARDLVLLLDRSGSMDGWKMVAARRAAARIVDTLTSGDRFAVLTFDHEIGWPDRLPSGLIAGTDRHRYRAVEHLARVDARGGTELAEPLAEALKLLRDEARDRVLVLVTDGQVGNEDQILREVAPGLAGVRVHTVGIDQAVNAGFLGRLAGLGGGRCELVESEDRLDDAMDRIHRRITAPTVSGVSIEADGLDLVPDTASPARVPDLFPGVPLVVTGRYKGGAGGAVKVSGLTPDEEPWSVSVPGAVADRPEVAKIWARGRLRDLEDRYVVRGTETLEREIVATSLRHGVLCRFTAFVAVDVRVVTDGAAPHQVTQLVELPAGWEPMADMQPELRRSGIAGPPSVSRARFGAAMPSLAGAPPAPPMMAAPTVISPSVMRGSGPVAAAEPAPPAPKPAGPAAPVGFSADYAAVGEYEDSDSASLSAPPTMGKKLRKPSGGAPSAQATPYGQVGGGGGAGGGAYGAGPGAGSVGGGAGYGPVPAKESEPVVADPALAAVAEQAAIELRRLQDAAAEPASVRRDLLDDLASRLDALVQDLVQRGAGQSAVESLRALVTVLRDGSVALADRWARAQAGLEELVALAAAAVAAAEAPAGRKAFWKR
ncbi:MAG TPA: VIT domain-containing protein [Actinocrinis sp.]|nr:VIT domain-containing protein [Actinocrinis sp.]